MRIRFITVLSVLVTTLFCTLPFSLAQAEAWHDHALRSPGEVGVFPVGPAQTADSSWPDLAGGSKSVTWQPLLLAANANDDKNNMNNNNGNNKVDVCHVLPNGKFITQNLPEETALKLIAEHPHEWILGKCEDVISPSHH